MLLPPRYLVIEAVGRSLSLFRHPLVRGITLKMEKLIELNNKKVTKYALQISEIRILH